MTYTPGVDGPNRQPGSSSSTGIRSNRPKYDTVDPSGGWVFPVPGGAWAGGGFLYFDSRDNNYHQGVDIHAPEGSAIHSPVSGTILASGNGGAGGNWVQVRGDDGLTYYFAHMQYPTHLAEGTQIVAGSQIGMVGNTGNAAGTGHHLHFTVKTHSGTLVDPRPLLQNGVDVASAQTQTQVAPNVNIPGGGDLYQVGGKQYVMFTIVGIEGAAWPVYYELAAGVTYPGQPKKLSASGWEQIAGEATDGGTSEAFRGMSPGTTFDEVMENTLFQMGIYGSDALSDPMVLAVIAEFISRPDMSDDEMTNRLRQTDWWSQHTEKEASWNDKSEAQQALDIIDAASQLAGVWFTYTGENINLADFDLDGDGNVTVDELRKGNADLAQHAEDIASGRSTQPTVINTWIKDYAEGVEDSPWARTLRNEQIEQGQFGMDVENTAADIMDTYQAYGIDLSWDEAMRMGHQVEMNERSLADIEMQVDEMAMAAYPTKPKGMTTRAWAQPYTQTMMTVLEVPDANLNDASLQRALAEGMTLGDFRKQLKSEDRWLDTKNARDEFNSTLSSLGNQMGF